MAKLSKRFKDEWQFYLNSYNRITFNRQCKKCVHTCKQSFRVKLLFCPNFKEKKELIVIRRTIHKTP